MWISKVNVKNAISFFLPVGWISTVSSSSTVYNYNLIKGHGKLDGGTYYLIATIFA